MGYSTVRNVMHGLQYYSTVRNDAAVTINWHFSTKDARIKLRRLYPELI